MPPAKPHYRAFISYSHRDAKWAKWLHRSLERYVIPIDVYPASENLNQGELKKNCRLTPVFRDRDELPASDSLADTIQQALELSENLIVLCSPNSAASQYVNAEIETFRKLHPDNGKKIYSLIIEGDPPECFPPALTADGAEPIAADARDSGDGKADAKLKLIAGILGVGFDRLKQREAKRQRNRLMMIVAAASVVAVMTSALALWALKAEGEATEQRTLAEQGQLAAEQQRELAEQSAAESKAVLNFLETRVLAAARPKGQAGGLGIDTTINEAINAAEPRIGKTFTDRPVVEASIRYTLGTSYIYLGQIDSAIKQYERSLKLRELELGFENSETLNTMSSLASSYWLAGQSAEALSLREKTLELKRKALGSEHPTTLLSMGDLGVSYKKAGRHAEALILQEEALSLHQKVMGAKHPYTLSMMVNLADTYYQSERYEDALSLKKESLGLLQKVLGAEHPNTLIVMNSLAVSYTQTERHEEALALREKILYLRKKVLGAGHPNTLSSMNSLAYHYNKNGRIKDAEKYYREYLALRKKQSSKDWQFYYAQSSLGAVLTEQKKYPAAETLLLDGYQGLKTVLPKTKIKWLKNSTEHLVKLYQDWGKTANASLWQKRLEALEKSAK